MQTTEGGLTFTTTLTSTRSEPQTIRPVLSAAFPLSQAAALLDTGADKRIPLVVPANQTFSSLSIPGSALRSRSLLMARAGVDRALRVELPKQEIQRIWLRADAKQGSIRMFVIFPPQELPANTGRSFSLTVSPEQPLPDQAVPPLSATVEHRADRLLVEDGMMKLGHLGQWGELVADHEAEDGFAMKLFNTHYQWCLQWHIDPALFEPDAKYKLRVRIRVEKTDRVGAAFWAGVYDMDRKKGWGQIQPQTTDVQDGYQWYDVATWMPESKQYIWVGPGMFDNNGGQSAIKAVYVDQFELTRVP